MCRLIAGTAAFFQLRGCCLVTRDGSCWCKLFFPLHWSTGPVVTGWYALHNDDRQVQQHTAAGRVCLTAMMRVDNSAWQHRYSRHSVHKAGQADKPSTQKFCTRKAEGDATPKWHVCFCLQPLAGFISDKQPAHQPSPAGSGKQRVDAPAHMATEVALLQPQALHHIDERAHRLGLIRFDERAHRLGLITFDTN